jgi:hypothetical protein
MAHSCLVAGIAAAVLSVGSLSFASDAVARSGGVGFGRGGGGGGHIGSNRGFARPFAHGRHMNRHAGRDHGRHHDHRRHGKDRFPQDGGVVPYGTVGYGDGSLGYPSQAGYPSQYGSGDPGAASRVFYRQVCRSDTQVVPSGRGGDTEVTVTPCYMVAE